MCGERHGVRSGSGSKSKLLDVVPFRFLIDQGGWCLVRTVAPPGLPEDNMSDLFRGLRFPGYRRSPLRGC